MNKNSEQETMSENSQDFVLDPDVIIMLKGIQEHLRLKTPAQALGHAIGTEKFLLDELTKNPGTKLILRYEDHSQREIFLLPKNEQK